GADRRRRRLHDPHTVAGRGARTRVASAAIPYALCTHSKRVLLLALTGQELENLINMYLPGVSRTLPRMGVAVLGRRALVMARRFFCLSGRWQTHRISSPE